jgi:NAD(P)H-dependent flavin oxidoreductase YrpB (nitropropane dioxygenase family)
LATPFFLLTTTRAYSVLVPACVDLIKAKGYRSPLTGRLVDVVAGGGICDGRGIAASFMYGASAVWVGTRFVTAIESSATDDAKQT